MDFKGRAQKRQGEKKPSVHIVGFSLSVIILFLFFRQALFVSAHVLKQILKSCSRSAGSAYLYLKKTQVISLLRIRKD